MRADTPWLCQKCFLCRWLHNDATSVLENLVWDARSESLSICVWKDNVFTCSLWVGACTNDKKIKNTDVKNSERNRMIKKKCNGEQKKETAVTDRESGRDRVELQKTKQGADCLQLLVLLWMHMPSSKPSENDGKLWLRSRLWNTYSE